jgi:hypothetical protein
MAEVIILFDGNLDNLHHGHWSTTSIITSKITPAAEQLANKQDRDFSFLILTYS